MVINILIADDDSDEVDFVQSCVQCVADDAAVEIDVAVAFTAERAVEAVRMKQFDVVVLDVVFSYRGLSGLYVAEVVWRYSAAAGVLIRGNYAGGCSAQELAYLRAKMPPGGQLYAVAKSADEDELVRICQRMIDSKIAVHG